MNGYKAEQWAVDILKAQGWNAGLVFDKQGRQSRGPFDVIAQKGPYKRHIQVKWRRHLADAKRELEGLTRWYARKFRSNSPFVSVEVWVFTIINSEYRLLTKAIK